ncbi:MAG: hypothetical protein ACOCTG_02035, partial [Bacteroidota bacterium]
MSRPLLVAAFWLALAGKVPIVLIAQPHDAPIDIVAADSLLRAVPDTVEVSHSLEQIYLDVVEQAGRQLSENDDRIVRRHVLRLIPMLPNSVREKISLHPKPRSIDYFDVLPDAGSVIQRWWRSQD